jgi:hypothetical protein
VGEALDEAWDGKFVRDVEGASEAATDEDVSARAMGGRRVRVGVDEEVGSEGKVKGAAAFLRLERGWSGACAMRFLDKENIAAVAERILI